MNLVQEEVLSYFANQVEKGMLTAILGCDSRHRSINTALNFLHKRSGSLITNLFRIDHSNCVFLFNLIDR